MTLNDIIVASLAQLDRGHDAQSLDVWRDKLTRFTNDAVLDLAEAFKLRRTEMVAHESGLFFLDALSHGCLSVLSVSQNGKRLVFCFGETADRVYVKNASAEELAVSYRFVPSLVSAPTDVPEVPEWCHGLIVTYVVGRERAAGEVSLQRGGNVYFQMYEAGKRQIRLHPGDAAAHKFINRW
ncbi:MAG TPA: hypothetical protein VN608_08490 [Clostridia bacterium]|nr:hypothetical protein [Clostridia bacterium]